MFSALPSWSPTFFMQSPFDLPEDRALDRLICPSRRSPIASPPSGTDRIPLPPAGDRRPLGPPIAAPRRRLPSPSPSPSVADRSAR
ncbi:hypothetical protein NL676_017332 [Syzygium grande]|nr:hypothetical protein NL676_017332 [Syzygium grande]